MAATGGSNWGIKICWESFQSCFSMNGIANGVLFLSDFSKYGSYSVVFAWRHIVAIVGSI